MSILTLFKFQVLVLVASYLLHFVYCTNWAAWNWQVSKFMVWWTMLIVPILGVLASCTLGKCLKLLPRGCFIANPGKIWPSRHFTAKKRYFHGISNLLCEFSRFLNLHLHNLFHTNFHLVQVISGSGVRKKIISWS